MSKLNSNHGFVSLLYSVADNPLRLWSKYVSAEQGRVRRIEDDILIGDRVIEIRGSDNSPIITNISCPANPLDCLNIKLPVLVVIVKNLRARFRIDLQLVDDEGIRRKFFVATYETSNNKSKVGTMIEYDTARVHLKLEEDWNELEIDLRSWCQSAFRTEYRALQRLIVHQNCRLRRIYLQDRHYKEGEASIEMCQAFFDMYMLKWGINFVEKACQVDGTPAEAKNEKTLTARLPSAVSSISSSAPIARQLHHEKTLNAKKSSPPKDKGPTGSRGVSAKLEVPSRQPVVGKAKSPRVEIAKKRQVSAAEKKAETPSRGKIDAASPRTKEKNSSNGNEREGQIFRKWPYNYPHVQRVGHELTMPTRSKPNPTDKKSSIFAAGKFASLLKTHERPFFRGNVPILPVNDVPPEVQRLAVTAESNEINDQRTIGKLLTTDESVDRYLELRHVIDRMILENFRSRGLTTISEVELSIYNSKNRRNSYGQDKLVESRRTSLEKACNVGNERAIEENEKSN